MEDRKGLKLGSQIAILFLHNWKIKLRQNKVIIAVEFLGPIALFCCYIYAFAQTPAEIYYEATGASPLRNVMDGQYLPDKVIHVVPDTDFAKNFANSLKDRLERAKPLRTMKFAFYENDAALMKAVDRDPQAHVLGLKLPRGPAEKFKYSIITNPLTDFAPDASQSRVSPGDCRKRLDGRQLLEDCPLRKYWYSSFLKLQKLISETVIQGTSNGSVELDVQVQSYPQNKTCDRAPIEGSRIFLPVFAAVCFAPIISLIYITIVEEETLGRRDHLRMIGIGDFAYWFSWLLTYSITMLFICIIMTVVLKFLPFTKHVNMLWLLLILFFFGISSISLAFLYSALFRNPEIAGSYAGIIQLMLAFFYLLLFPKIETSSSRALMLLSPAAGTCAIYELLQQTCIQVGMSEFRPGGIAQDVFYALLFLLLDTVLYFWIGIYLHSFFGTEKVNELNDASAIQGIPVEKVPPALRARPNIQVKNLSEDRKLVGISLTAYEGNITAILGPNGAGKSTLLNILAGLHRRYKGEVTVLGLDVRCIKKVAPPEIVFDSHSRNEANLSIVRKSLGVCPPMLFETLTVEEHLLLYAKLRGIPATQLKEEVESVMAELDLTEKRQWASKTLSPGQQRKLSVGIALIGDPKIVLLNDPTSGLDPVSQTKVWALLRKRKSGKIILLTTHSMDEADSIADQIGIICQGKLQCMGSSPFLKGQFGSGYRLTLELSDRDVITNAADAVIKKNIPSALESRQKLSKEVTYFLPLLEAKKFPGIIGEMEQLLDPKGPYINLGVRTASFEDVFLKVSADTKVIENTKEKEEAGGQDESGKKPQTPMEIAEPECEPTQRDSLAIVMTLGWKRLRASWRACNYFWFFIVYPTILTSVTFHRFRYGVKSANVGFTSLNDDYFSARSLAISDIGESSLLKYLQEKKVKVVAFSGGMDDLLRIGGTDAAITILEQSLNPTNIKLKAILRVNETSAHIPGYAFSVMASYVAAKSNREEPIGSLQNFPVRTYDQVFRGGLMFTAILGFYLVYLYYVLAIDFVTDRENRRWSQLRLSGLRLYQYIGGFMVEYGLVAIVMSGIAVIIVTSLGVPSYAVPSAAGWICFLIFLHIPAGILASAVLSHLFDRSYTARRVLLLPMLASTIAFTLSLMYTPPIPFSAKYWFLLYSVFNVFFVPPAALGFVHLIYEHNYRRGMAQNLTFGSYCVFEIYTLAIISIVQTLVLYGILVLLDKFKSGRGWRSCFSKFAKTEAVEANKVEGSKPGDADVENEARNVSKYMQGELEQSKFAVAAQEIHKTYRNGRTIKSVLRGMNFLVEEGHIFAIVSPNGAGRTTLVRVLTAQEPMDSGKVKLLDRIVKATGPFDQIGLCPQEDAMWPLLTVRENLYLHGVVQGVPEKNLEGAVEAYLKILRIEEYANFAVVYLSRGTKRKLSYGICMISCPRLVIFDEPFIGLDPVSKRALCDHLIGSIKGKRSAVIATYSMEEAEVLSSRIGILGNGTLAYVGSPQHLKSKFGSGYTLELKIRQETLSQELLDHSEADQATVSFHSTHTAESVKLSNGKSGNFPPQFKFLSKQFPNASVVKTFGDKGVFSIPKSDAGSVSNLFKYLESSK